jgi:hypothetical protein
LFFTASDNSIPENVNITAVEFVSGAGTPTPTPGDTATPTPTPTGPSDPPTVKLFSPSQIEEMAVKTYKIKFYAYDSDSDAKVSLYYDTDNSGQDGTRIIDNISEDSDASEYDWNLIGVPQGVYYVYATISDYVNPPVVFYSSGTVMVLGIIRYDIIDIVLGIKNILPGEFKYYDVNKDLIIDIADLIKFLSLAK